MTGSILFTVLYLVFLLALILFCAWSSRKFEEDRQSKLVHWDEE
jgi:flagellar biogenesis protein FliO